MDDLLVVSYDVAEQEIGRGSVSQASPAYLCVKYVLILSYMTVFEYLRVTGDDSRQRPGKVKSVEQW